MESNVEKPAVAVVGLGLMGCSIVTCLLMAGHKVVAVAPIPSDMDTAYGRVMAHLIKSKEQGLTTVEPDDFMSSLLITEDYTELKDVELVIECTLEDLSVKKTVYAKIEANVAIDTVITSNTSAIPISILQAESKHPERFLGLHWAEPSHTTRFLEIICGEKSDLKYANWLYDLSHAWGKEPTLVKRDIRGFIANRLMYAMYREAFYLVENGYATVEDVDRACRNNTGYWMTLVGVFRWMDLTGVPAYHNVMKDLLPTLCNDKKVPELMESVVADGARGTANAKGFYDYTPEEAKMWEKVFEEFSYEIRTLALKYPADVVKQRMNVESRA